MCIDLHQNRSVGEGGDHLQLIEFWPSRAPGKGVCSAAKIFRSALLKPVRSVCVSSERFFSLGIVLKLSGSVIRYICLSHCSCELVTEVY